MTPSGLERGTRFRAARGGLDTAKRIAATIMILVLGAWIVSGAADRLAVDHVDQGFKRALVTFGVARTINGLLSLVQSAEVAVQPGGVGVRLAPGEVLEPVNDLIERFSWVMLASSTSLGLQKVLLRITSGVWLTGLVVVLGLLTIIAVWWPIPLGRRSRSWLVKLAAIGFAVRLAIPALAAGSEAAYRAFLESEYESSLAGLRQVSARLEEVGTAHRGTAGTAAGSFLEQLRHWYDATTQSFDVAAQVAAYGEALGDASEHTIRLIVVFLLQTALFPLIFLWVIVRATRWVIRM